MLQGAHSDRKMRRTCFGLWGPLGLGELLGGHGAGPPCWKLSPSLREHHSWCGNSISAINPLGRKNGAVFIPTFICLTALLRCNSHAIQLVHSFKAYNPVVFRIFTDMGNRHHC